MSGGPGDDRARGGSGDDRVKGGTGKDTMSGQSGDDRLNAVDHARDESVNCGSGRDRARVDRVDPVSRNCEIVVIVR